MYKSLQAGRAIAAVLVVLFHLGATLAKDSYFGIAEFAIPFAFGNAGVEFFFVLSGFIIFTAHRQDISQPHRLLSYLRKRVIRIYPTYWIIFLSVLIVALILPHTRNSVPHDVITLFSSLALIPQDRSLVGGVGAPVISVAWTLQYEITFYLFFSLLIISLRLAMLVLGLLFSAYLYMYVIGYPADSFIWEFIFNDYIVLFFAGMVVSWLINFRQSISESPLFFVYSGLLIFLITAADVVFFDGQSIERKTLLYGAASCLIVYGLVVAEEIGIVSLDHKWLQLLGGASYALYLIHFPLISLLCKLTLALNLDKLGIIGALISYVFIIVSCLLVAVTFHLRIERPIAAYFSTSGSPKTIN